jgi:hypothetical protein
LGAPGGGSGGRHLGAGRRRRPDRQRHQQRIAAVGRARARGYVAERYHGRDRDRLTDLGADTDRDCFSYGRTQPEGHDL